MGFTFLFFLCFLCCWPFKGFQLACVLWSIMWHVCGEFFDNRKLVSGSCRHWTRSVGSVTGHFASSVFFSVFSSAANKDCATAVDCIWLGERVRDWKERWLSVQVPIEQSSKSKPLNDSINSRLVNSLFVNSFHVSYNQAINNIVKFFSSEYKSQVTGSER